MSDPLSASIFETVRAELQAASAQPRAAAAGSPDFAATLAQCTAPLFSPWPMPAAARPDLPRPPDTALNTHAADQRRDRRQRRGG